MEEPDVAICLRHARDEMLLALDAASIEEETEHRTQATALMAEAVRSISQHPESKHDWAGLRPAPASPH
jgi:hypothetical protein